MGVIPEECPMHQNYKLKTAETPLEESPPPSVTIIPNIAPSVETEVVASSVETEVVASSVETEVVTPSADSVNPPPTSTSTTEHIPHDASSDALPPPPSVSVPAAPVATIEEGMPPGQTFVSKSHIQKGKNKPTWIDLSEEMVQEDTPQEMALNEILLWENFIGSDLDELKLLRYCNKPREYSPHARFRGLLGYGLPFNRHDWIIDRSGREVRYVIDYYDLGDENGYHTGENIELDVRPAFNSIDAIFYRAKAAVLRRVADVFQWWNPSSAHHHHHVIDVSTDSTDDGSDASKT